MTITVQLVTVGEESQNEEHSDVQHLNSILIQAFVLKGHVMGNQIFLAFSARKKVYFGKFILSVFFFWSKMVIKQCKLVFSSLTSHHIPKTSLVTLSSWLVDLLLVQDGLPTRTTPIVSWL